MFAIEHSGVEPDMLLFAEPVWVDPITSDPPIGDPDEVRADAGRLSDGD